MIDFDTSEVRELAATLTNAAGHVGAKASKAVRKTALDIQRDAQIAAPYEFGNLQSSISTTVTGDGRHGEMSAEVGPTASYGLWQELGTSKMAAQPFLFPAADRHEPVFIEAIAQLGGSVL
ncbi:phage protein, HK97 gp10 family [Georgenia satyanarayanai]|uniref:Phage protein, HK97 gp10 family n=1 Tax=Georgenia satyanarayanai TaxID=860221 RepID=A0A2Y9A864_9MICO|nr:HK97-gp10 family putative phage morphogenesis protein [Georgenia satyanarayanai]PYG00164.1 HK97 gp10 family phage protein [Georgenia satyanarayanai]SSA40385.1 phage protein, HK97 gp10 family [Georgenia satyanarayanai]